MEYQQLEHCFQLTPRGLLQVIEKLVRDRKAAEETASFALQAVHELENHILELNALLTEAQAAIENLTICNEASNTKPTNQLLPPQATWIVNNTWLSLAANNPLITDIEKKWQRGDTQYALALMDMYNREETNITAEDALRLRLLKSAIFHSIDDPAMSMQLADSVLRECNTRRVNDFVTFRQLGGIAHFLRGKNFLAVRDRRAAYMAFSHAMTAPGYEQQARRMKEVAWLWMVEAGQGQEHKHKEKSGGGYLPASKITASAVCNGDFEEISL
ncbi:hypothetical protein AJ80_07010 [Polytolypa hystricis UAMH7299]|uniref:Uncharacterized protein n=1 Tax=Polytolypa hystricis (strain UAMH7299) TaxID=1447883 RepID=A0A2B7XS12_POLH7|nr:hypothetical protein AJ80_07010 [Polytolypa hystricis UAMH7299]